MSEYRNYDDEWLLNSDSYMKHVSAMTGEKLHSKADIAAELAYRDDRITELEAELPKWVSVGERLPEYPDEVLCLTSSEVCHICKFCQLSGLWMKGISYERMDTVTHWMPLPQPPKEQDHE